MQRNSTLLKNCETILEEIRKADIISSFSPNFNIIRNALRRATALSAQAYKMPVMTGAVATTYLHHGVCTELSYRFALEYISKFKMQDVHLVHIGDGKAIKNEDHIFVVVGPIQADDSLFIGRGDQSIVSLHNRGGVALDAFLKANPNTVVVDPLLNFAAMSSGDVSSLKKYIKVYNCPNVIAIKSFSTTMNLISNIDDVRKNALSIASQLKDLAWAKTQLTLNEYFLFKPIKSSPNIDPLDKDGEPTTKMDFYLSK